jgi:hypothetical protein
MRAQSQWRHLPVVYDLVICESDLERSVFLRRQRSVNTAGEHQRTAERSDWVFVSCARREMGMFFADQQRAALQLILPGKQCF